MAELRSRTIFSDHRFTVVVVESIECQHGRSGHGHHLTASLKPVAVVIEEPDRTYAVDMDAKSVNIDQLSPPFNETL